MPSDLVGSFQIHHDLVHPVRGQLGGPGEIDFGGGPQAARPGWGAAPAAIAGSSRGVASAQARSFPVRRPRRCAKWGLIPVSPRHWQPAPRKLDRHNVSTVRSINHRSFGVQLNHIKAFVSLSVTMIWPKLVTGTCFSSILPLNIMLRGDTESKPSNINKIYGGSGNGAAASRLTA